MRALIQRVQQASVQVAGDTVAQIEAGALVLLGVAPEDGPADLEWLAGKIVRLRIFADAEGRMNRSLLEVQGQLLLVSQFTLMASTAKGNRPSWSGAAGPELAQPLFEQMAAHLTRLLGRAVPTGVFGADMQVSLINDGPVTVWLDSKRPE